jgi:hypothetical protein
MSARQEWLPLGRRSVLPLAAVLVWTLVPTCSSGSGSHVGGGGAGGAARGSTAGTSGVAGLGGGRQTGSGGSTTGSAGTSGGGPGQAGTAGLAGANGVAGNIGTAGSGSQTTGAAGTTGTAGSPAPGDQSVLQRGHDLMRHATFAQPALTKTAAATMAPDATFNSNAKVSGSVKASVLYLQNGPAAAGCPAAASGCTAKSRDAGAGLFFAVSESGGAYAFDETSGLVVWHAGLPAGGDGVRGTPAIDAGTRTLFVALGASGHHEVHALSVDDGTERAGWPLMLSGSNLSANGVSFNSSVQNEHGALLVLNNILYVPFGGEYGDRGTYRGWVVAVDITNPTKFVGWVTAGAKEGIWAHGGFASDGASVFAVTSNGSAGSHNNAGTDAEEVVRFTGMASFTRSAANVYYPAAWQQMDGTDKDFGSSSPAYVPLPAGSTPAAIMVAPAKPGRVYILDGTNLSSGKYPSAGGELAELTVADTAAESVYTSPTVYNSASGIHAAIDVGHGPANCPNQIQGNHAIISLLIQPGSTPIAKEVWCAAVTGNTGGTQQNGPPISTTTDGNAANAMVWFMNGTQLSAVDGDTGTPVFTTNGPGCSTPNMSFPIAVNGRIVVASNGGLCSWSPGGQ